MDVNMKEVEAVIINDFIKMDSFINDIWFISYIVNIFDIIFYILIHIDVKFFKKSLLLVYLILIFYMSCIDIYDQNKNNILTIIY